jgi:prepilin-type N-terminal cleavage/methylation domain-containing protein
MKAAGSESGIAQAGMTMIEVMLALMITAITSLAIFQLLAFGTVELEKLGYRREALGLLKGELEFWRARFQVASADAPVKPAEADIRSRLENLGGMEFRVEPEVSMPRQNRDLRYQEVRVRVSYSRGDLADTLDMETRQYVR